MKVAVRYQSRGGHVKAMAEALARGAGVEALSIDDPRAKLKEPVDILFIGGALYKFQLDPGLKAYVAALPEGIVRDRAVCFGSSFLTRRPIFLLQDELRARGITVSPQGAYARNKPNRLLLEALEVFGRVETEHDPESEDRPAPVQYVIKAEKNIAEAEEAEAAAAAEDVAEATEAGEE